MKKDLGGFSHYCGPDHDRRPTRTDATCASGR